MKDPKQVDILYAFITFRSMEGLENMLDSFNYTWKHRCCIKFWNRCGCFRKQAEKIKIREFDGHWPYPEVAILPDNIQWQNIGVGNFSRNIRWFIVQVIVAVVVVSAFMGILWAKTAGEEYKSDFKINDECPEVVTKAAALSDQRQPPSNQEGLMHCFCFDKVINQLNNDARFISF